MKCRYEVPYVPLLDIAANPDRWFCRRLIVIMRTFSVILPRRSLQGTIPLFINTVIRGFWLIMLVKQTKFAVVFRTSQRFLHRASVLVRLKLVCAEPAGGCDIFLTWAELGCTSKSNNHPCHFPLRNSLLNNNGCCPTLPQPCTHN